MVDIGALLNCRSENFDFLSSFSEAKEMGLSSCQICVWKPDFYTPENAKAILEASKRLNFGVSCLWAGYTGPCRWNLTEGPKTIGLVPSQFRAMRVKQLEKASEFAEYIGIGDIATHVGFIPEDPSTTAYCELIDTLRELCTLYQSRGQNFLFETGQETPEAILRTIEDVGTGNTYINFDTANLILYGKGDPTDAARAFGKYVRNTHIKDGFYPTADGELGREVKVGEGLCDFPAVLKILKSHGYDGPYTIEREITGPEQKQDIMDTAVYLKSILKAL